MELMQEIQTIALVSGQGMVSAHTCRISGRVAEISATSPGDLRLEAGVLAQVDELRLNISADPVQVFLPLVSAEKKLHVSVDLTANASARLFLLSTGRSRNLQTVINALDHSRAEVFSLLDDTAAHVIFEANVHAGTQVSFTGLTRTQGTTATAIEVNVRHLQGNSRTEQKFFSYARDTSQISFTGRIAVDPGASGTEAHQLHRGVALSAGARIDAQPFLNIMHDDVRCTHGSTVGFIDEEALAYLMARGLGRSVAEQILIHSSERQFFDLVPAGAAREFFGFAEEQL
jgi:Fe-S cluster assembly protein SufD